MRYTGGAWPDADGMVGRNRGGFKSPEFQGGAMQAMLRAIVGNSPHGIERCWLAIDATFRQQTERGNFGRDGAPHGGPSAVAFWLADLGQAMLVLRESDFGPKYQQRDRRDFAENPSGRPMACPTALSKSPEARGRRCPQSSAVRCLGLWTVGLVDRRRRVEAAGPPLRRSGDGRLSPERRRVSRKRRVRFELSGRRGAEAPGLGGPLPRSKLEAAIDRAVCWEIGRSRSRTVGSTWRATPAPGWDKNNGWAATRASTSAR